MRRSRRARWVVLGGVLALALGGAASARADAPTSPDDVPVVLSPQDPLARLGDDAALDAAVTAIVRDPALAADPRRRAVARTLAAGAFRELRAGQPEQALADLLDAYARLPNPRFLLVIAGVLHAMDRLADSANTLDRFLRDPGAPRARAAEITARLADLDAQLTVLTVQVSRAAAVSIDGGPAVPVGHILITRLRPGLHLVRARSARGRQLAEATVNAFVGDHKLLAINLADDGSPVMANAEPVYGWLVTGTEYSTGTAPTERYVHHGFAGPVVAATTVPDELSLEAGPAAALPAPGGSGDAAASEPIRSGAAIQFVADATHRGGALAIALDFAVDRRIEVEAALLTSTNNQGGSLGARYRLLTGRVRPYVAVGVPALLFHGAIVVGARFAAGVELPFSRHFSVQGELGYEHFFGDEVDGMYPYFQNLFVPLVGVIGRL